MLAKNPFAGIAVSFQQIILFFFPNYLSFSLRFLSVYPFSSYDNYLLLCSIR